MKKSTPEIYSAGTEKPNLGQAEKVAAQRPEFSRMPVKDNIADQNANIRENTPDGLPPIGSVFVA